MKRSRLQRQHFFDKIVKLEPWKNSMAGRNEDKVLEILNNLGFRLGIDYFRQYPIGERFVIDIAFVKEQIAIEVDGQSHETKKQKKMDVARDKFLRFNNWVPIRIKDKDFFGFKGSFYKSLIKMVIDERQEQWSRGNLYPVEIPSFDEEDYPISD